MKLGFMQVYNEVNWVGFAIDQAMKLCDRLLVVEGSQFVAFPGIPERSDDGTLDIIADKAKECGDRFIWINTIREHLNYRKNQSANFNRGLAYCNMGDYFIQLDADEFYFDEWIVEANELMKEGKVDFIRAQGYVFAFSFGWTVELGDIPGLNPSIIKKVEGLHFVPTHKCVNHGKNITTIPLRGFYHYMWVKPTKRILMRMKTSGRYAGMVGWFETMWCKMKLEDGKTYRSFNGKFTLRRYDGEHPSILADHPWRNIEDIRRIE